MGGTSFTGHPDVTVKAGDTVTFSDPSSGGGFHNLVTGTSGTFAAEPGAPSQFASSSGMAFSPGDSVDITFSTPGTYHITCTIHPTMQATVTVTS
jgi:plastocyanin